MIPGPLPCVRCGRRPRAGELFLCNPCAASPMVRAEVRRIEQGAQGYIAQRRLAIEKFHWAGGWGSHPADRAAQLRATL
jgi:hypothetical protein